MSLIEKWNPNSENDKCTNPTCRNEVVKGTPYCSQHGGMSILRRSEHRQLQNYNLDKWFATNDIQKKLMDQSGIKSLASEVILLRQTLETLLKSCTNTVELIANEFRVRELIRCIRETVESMHGLDKDINANLNEEQLLVLADTLVIILRESEVPEAVVDKVIQKIQNVIGGEGNSDLSQLPCEIPIADNVI